MQNTAKAGAALVISQVYKFRSIHNNFVKNKAAIAGAGINIDHFTSIDIVHCRFVHNEKETVHLEQGVSGTSKMSFNNKYLSYPKTDRVVFHKSHFINNTGQNTGAIRIAFGKFLLIQLCYGYNNYAIYHGGVFHGEDVQKVIIQRSIFTMNQAGSGGCLAIKSPIYVTITGSKFFHNIAFQQGGSLYIESVKHKTSSITLSFNAFVIADHESNEMGEKGIAISVQNIETLLIRYVNCHTIVKKSTSMETVFEVNVDILEISFVKMTSMVSIAYHLEAFVNKFAEFLHILFKCPLDTYMDKAHSFVSIVHQFHIYYKCTRCAHKFYTLASSKYSVTHWKIQGQETDVAENKCHQCPFHAICENGKIHVLSSYWGYKSKYQVIVMSCPPDYCCRGTTCTSYNTCNNHRQGLLCSQCISNYSVSLKNSKCLPTKNCNSFFVAMYLIFNILGYSFYLLFKTDCITSIIAYAKLIYTKLVGRLKHNRIGVTSHENGSLKHKENVFSEETYAHIWTLSVYHFQDISLLSDIDHKANIGK